MHTHKHAPPHMCSHTDLFVYIRKETGTLKKWLGTGELAQQFGDLIALEEALDLIPSMHVVALDRL